MSERGKDKEKAMAIPMRPAQPASMVEGPLIQPSKPLLDWLEKNSRTATGKRLRFRLPVVVRFEDQYRLALSGAFIGTTEADGGAQAILLGLDDTGMGTALIDQLRDRCPKSTNSCAVWLEGYWGQLVEAPMPESPSTAGIKKHPFAVLRVHGMIDPQARQAEPIHAMIEARP